MRGIPGKGKRERFLKGLASEDLTGILVRKGFEAARKEVLCRLKKSGF
jgi:hypothetical protein